MKHLKFIHQLTQFCIRELDLRQAEYQRLTQQEDYSYHSQGYLAGQIDTLVKILDMLYNYDVPEWKGG